MILKFESDRQNCQILHKKYVYNFLAICKQRLSLSLRGYRIFWLQARFNNGGYRSYTSKEDIGEEITLVGPWLIFSAFCLCTSLGTLIFCPLQHQRREEEGRFLFQSRLWHLSPSY